MPIHDPESTRATHPLVTAINNAPLSPISDEENAVLDGIVSNTSQWLTDEEFVAAVGPISAREQAAR